MERIEPKYILTEEEYERLLKAEKLLTDVWLVAGPYGFLSKETWQLGSDLQDFFNFDDSE
jgi:hypothetical protein